MEKIQRLIGTSASIRELDDELTYTARSDAKVLITGESGVGKEVVARLIHHRSHRSNGPLVTINCAGVPDTLLESELFGHVRGSFTDAHRDKRGQLELAHRGTVFMDEIGEMSLRMQALLLRFLETGEIQNVGSDSRQRRVDVRVVVATNRDLRQRIASNEFREDLFYRLNVIHLQLTPLRERLEDVVPLANHFLRVYGDMQGVAQPELSVDAAAMISAYRWPGNIRELRNVIERVVVRGQGRPITPADLPPEISASREAIVPAVHRPAVSSVAGTLFDRIVHGGEPFWSAVYEPFMARDLTRADLRMVVSQGLSATRGSYKGLVQLFNLDPDDYKRFLNCLRKYECHMAFQAFRCVPVRVPAETDRTTHPAAESSTSVREVRERQIAIAR